MSFAEIRREFLQMFIGAFAITLAVLMALFGVMTFSQAIRGPEKATPAGLDADMRRLLERVDIGQDRLEAVTPCNRNESSVNYHHAHPPPEMVRRVFHWAAPTANPERKSDRYTREFGAVSGPSS